MAHFESLDATTLGDAGFEIRSRGFLRQLIRDGQRINLKSDLTSDGVKFQLNFHTPVQNAEEATTAIRGKALGCRELALKLLLDIYNLDLEIDDE